MMKQTPEVTAISFSEEETRRILQRAAELDRVLAGRLSAVAVRDAALQAGISEAAIEQAIREETSAITPAPDEPQSRFVLSRVRRWIELSGIAAIATGAGAIARFFEPRYSSLSTPTFAIALGLVVLGVLLATESRERGERKMLHQLKNLLLWAGFAAGWWFFEREPRVSTAEDFFRLTMTAEMVTALIGAVVMGFKGFLPKPRDSQGAAEMTGASTVGVGA